jgi:hypothetical protein
MDDLPSPFISVEGLANVRGIGDWPIVDETGNATGKIRSGIYFRGPDTSPITPNGEATLRRVGVKTIFDLRSQPQIDRAGGYREIEGISRIWCPVFAAEEYTQEKAGLRYQQYAGDGIEVKHPILFLEQSVLTLQQGIVQAFTEILVHGAPAFRQILLYIASLPTPTESAPAMTEHPASQPRACFVNCTTGNNRTGPFTGILLSLLGVPKDQIAAEYALSDKGLAPVRPKVVARLVKNPKFAAAFGDEVEKRAIRMVGARPESMLGMLEMVQDKWGSAENYIKLECGLTDEEIAKIKAVMVVKP